MPAAVTEQFLGGQAEGGVGSRSGEDAGAWSATAAGAVELHYLAACIGQVAFDSDIERCPVIEAIGFDLIFGRCLHKSRWIDGARILFGEHALVFEDLGVSLFANLRGDLIDRRLGLSFHCCCSCMGVCNYCIARRTSVGMHIYPSISRFGVQESARRIRNRADRESRYSTCLAK